MFSSWTNPRAAAMNGFLEKHGIRLNTNMLLPEASRGAQETCESGGGTGFFPTVVSSPLAASRGPSS